MLLSFVLAGWMICRAVGLLTGPATSNKALQSCWIDTRSSELYERTQSVVCATDQKLFDEALKEARTGQSEAPTNPLFRYLEAVAAWKSGNTALALKAIDAGNRRGTIEFYAPENLPPDRWQWPEVRLISGLGMSIIERFPSNKHALMSSLVMGHRLVWSELPDMARILHGLHLRKIAAEKLLIIAEKENDSALAKLCQKLIDETLPLENAVNSRNIEEAGKGIIVDNFRDLLPSDYNKHNPRLKDTAMFIMRAKQVELSNQLRNKYLHTRSLGVFEP